MAGVIVRGGIGSLEQEVLAGRHRLVGDEPEGPDGHDAGPSPYDYLLAALGTCTSMTLTLYARRKQWPLETITVRLQHSRVYATDCAECETKEGRIDRIDREIALGGPHRPDRPRDRARGAASTGSTARSRSGGRSTTGSARGCSRSPTAARCTAP